MKFINFFMVISTVITLTGCGSSSPSDSDAKKAVEQMIGGCKFLTLENFEKVNGIAGPQGSHIVQLKYSVKVKALPDSAKIYSDSSQKLAEIDTRLKKAEEERNANFEKREKSTGYVDTKFIFETLNPSIQLATNIKKEKEEFLAQATKPLSDKFKSECSNVNLALYSDLFPSNDLSLYAKEFTKEFNGKMIMVKTDNGWVSAN